MFCVGMWTFVRWHKYLTWMVNGINGKSARNSEKSFKSILLLSCAFDSWMGKNGKNVKSLDAYMQSLNKFKMRVFVTKTNKKGSLNLQLNIEHCCDEWDLNFFDSGTAIFIFFLFISFSVEKLGIEAYKMWTDQIQ